MIETGNDPDEGLNLNLTAINWNSKGTQKTSSLNLVLEPTNEENSALKLSLNSNRVTGKNEITNQYTGNCTLTDKGRKVGDISLKYNSTGIPEKNGKRQSESDFELLSSGNFYFPALKGKIRRVIDRI